MSWRVTIPTSSPSSTTGIRWILCWTMKSMARSSLSSGQTAWTS